MKKRLRVLFLFFVWLQFRLARLTKSYPSNIIVKRGYIDLRLGSTIKLEGKSRLLVDGNLILSHSSIILVDAEFVSGNLIITKSTISLSSTDAMLGADGIITDTTIKAKDSHIEILDYYKIVNFSIKLSSSKIKSKCYLGITNDMRYPLQINFINTIGILGQNVNLHCIIDCKQGNLFMGDNVFINSGTQIRCENSISIGSNVFISYDCIIFDTNTHAVDPEVRQQEIDLGFPNFTRQTIHSLPQTAPISIGNQVWIGMRSAILKGTTLGTGCVVGLMSVVSGEYDNYCLIVGNPGKYVKKVKINELLQI